MVDVMQMLKINAQLNISRDAFQLGSQYRQPNESGCSFKFQSGDFLLLIYRQPHVQM